MATCKDYIHYEVCQDGVCDECFTEETPKTVREMYSPLGCETFKNKADFVEVVRCKDCKYWRTEHGGFCEASNALSEVNNENNDYCSYGERK